MGEWSDPSISTPLTLKKGRYAAAAIYLDLPAEARKQLKGRWSGTLSGLPREEYERDDGVTRPPAVRRG